MSDTDLAELPFPRRVRDGLIAAGRAKAHHVLPDSGWVSRVIRSTEGLEDLVGLFRLSCERLAAIGAPRKRDAQGGEGDG